MYFLKFEFLDFLLSLQETNHQLNYFESNIKLLILDSCFFYKKKKLMSNRTVGRFSYRVGYITLLIQIIRSEFLRYFPSWRTWSTAATGLFILIRTEMSSRDSEFRIHQWNRIYGVVGDRTPISPLPSFAKPSSSFLAN